MPVPELTLHVLPPSHPCMTVEAALRFKGLHYEKVSLTPGPHVEEMQRLHGEGHCTVPGLLVGDEPVHGSRPILTRLERRYVDALVAADVIGGERPNAADLQIGATLRVLLTLGSLQPLIDGRPFEPVARRWFPEYPGEVPAGAFPAGWAPSSS